MAERKVSKPRVVRMRVTWWGRAPDHVEVRDVKPRKSGKGKVKR